MKTEVRMVLSGLAGKLFVVNRPRVPMMREMPFFFQRMKDLSSLDQAEERESKNQQPADRFA